MSYGCKNRPPFAAAQVLYGHRAVDGRPIRILVPNRMEPDCQYTKTALGQVDAGCAGCKHKTNQPLAIVNTAQAAIN